MNEEERPEGGGRRMMEKEEEELKVSKSRMGGRGGILYVQDLGRAIEKSLLLSTWWMLSPGLLSPLPARGPASRVSPRKELGARLIGRPRGGGRVSQTPAG